MSLDPVPPITIRPVKVPLTIPERIAALADQADLMDYDVCELKNEIDKMSEYEEGDVPGYMKEALKCADILFIALDKAKNDAAKVVVPAHLKKLCASVGIGGEAHL